MSALPGNIGKPNTAAKLEPNAVVEFEHSGNPLVGIVTGEKKGKWVIFSQRGKEVELPATRIFRYPHRVSDLPAASSERVALLESFLAEADTIKESIDLEALWQTVLNEIAEPTSSELTNLYFGKDSFINHLALRRLLIEDQTYFKRRKSGFEPRSEDAVEQMQVQRRVEEEKQRARENLISSLSDILQGKDVEPPSNLEAIEQLAALGTNANNHKETHEIVEAVFDRAKLTIKGRAEDRAYELLVRIGHFSPHECLALYRFRRPTAFSQALLEEAEKLSSVPFSAHEAGREDLRDVYMVTVDSEETKDIDDAISLEETAEGYRCGIHISDVAAIIAFDSPLDQEARSRGTSIYCPTFRIPMLPQRLSEGSFSLVEGEERLALSFLVDFDSNFEITGRTITQSIIKSNKRLSYDQVDDLLCDESSRESIDEVSDRILPILWNLTTCLEEQRIERGAVAFNRREKTPAVDENLNIELVESFEESPSRKLIGELMILANETAALFAKDNLIPLVFRGQDAPDVDIEEESLAAPEGPAREFFIRSLMKRSIASTKAEQHFGLGLTAYAHATSPIRRAADLVNQRQIVSFLKTGKPQFEAQKVMELAAETENGIQEANYIQRESNRSWLFRYLKHNKIKELSGTVVKVVGKKPLAEIEHIFSLLPFNPADKSGSGAPKLGDAVRLKIARLNPKRDDIVLEQIK